MTEYISKVQDEDTGKIAYFKDSKAREDIKALNSQYKENQINLIEDDTSMEGISDSVHDTLETDDKKIIPAINEVNAKLKDIAKKTITEEERNKLTNLENYDDSSIKNDIQTQKARIDSFTSLKEGSTTGDAELIDARVGIDGIVYDNLGDSIREQLKVANNEIFNFSITEVTKHDNSWIYGNYIQTSDGYVVFSFRIYPGKTYEIRRSSSGALGIGFNTAGFVLEYEVKNYARHDGLKYTIIIPENFEYNWCHVFCGTNDSTIQVFEKDSYVKNINNKVSLLKDKIENTNSNILFEIGGISDGNMVDSTNRVRSNFIKVFKGDIINLNYYDMVVFIYDENKIYKENSYSKFSDWIDSYNVEKDGYVKVVCRKDSKNSIFYNYDVYRIKNDLCISSIPSTIAGSKLNTSMKIRSLDGMENIIDNMTEEQAYAQTYKKRGKIVKKGNKLVGSDGKDIVITGIGTHSLSEYNNLYTPEVMKTLIYNGINCIRISVYLSDNQFIKSSGRTSLGWLNHSDELKRIINELIEVATESGLYIILDWHSFHAKDGGDVTQYTAEQQEFFTYFSNKYANKDNIIYELHNEPYKNTASELLDGVKKCASIIRNNNPDAVLITGHGSDGTWVMNSLFNETNNLNIFISPHLYTGEQNVDFIKDCIRSTAPIFVTEWGNSSLSGDDTPNDTMAQAMFDYCHQEGISYCLWKLTYQAMDTAILNYDNNRATYSYGYGGWRNSDLSHNGKFYFKNIKKYRFNN
jgi:endoglucanase